MLPVALALLGTGARRPTVAFLGWFGPRNLASIVFAVIPIDDTIELHRPKHGASELVLARASITSAVPQRTSCRRPSSL